MLCKSGLLLIEEVGIATDDFQPLKACRTRLNETPVSSTGNRHLLELQRYVLVEATRNCWLASLAIRRGRREFRE